MLIRIIIALIWLAVCAFPANTQTPSAADEPQRVLEYGDGNWEDEMARLDYFANFLWNKPNLVGYIIIYGGRRDRRGYAQKRAACIKYYMFDRIGFDNNQINVINGGYRESSTVEMWIIPRGGCAPKATPTVAPKDIRFNKRGKRYYCEI